MEPKSDSELRYRIRANTQLFAEQSEITHELHERIKEYLDNQRDPDRFKKIDELLKILRETTKKNDRILKEIQDDLAELQEAKIKH